MARLNTFVHVVESGGEGRSAMFGPADALPDWAVAAISNPDVWADGAPVPTVETNPAETKPDPQTPASGIPPKGGAGSGAPAWREYAASKGVEVADDASREDVWAALEKANVPTE